MGTRDVTTTVYRGYNIVINPSNKPEDALKDAFMILEPSANPMFTKTLHENPRERLETYGTEDEAKAAAMMLAKAWIDEHLGRPTD